MQDMRLGALMRVIRIRKNKRQGDIAAQSGISASAIARHERGEFQSTSVRSVRSHGQALGLRIELTVRGPVDAQMLDEEHAAVANHLKRWFESLGWEAIAEQSYSEYGERGRIDLFCWHPGRQVLLVVEIKSEIRDAQELLGSLDAKERLARTIALRRGWNARSVAVMLAVTETNRNLGRINRFRSLFDGYSLRGTAARRWIAAPGGSARLLLSVKPGEAGRQTWRNGRQRVRVARQADG